MKVTVTNKKTTTKKANSPAVRSIDQMSFARMIAQKFGLKISEVIAVVEEEQKLTMEYVRMGYRVVKKNYLTLESKPFAGKKDWVCPLNGKKYDLNASARVYVRVGIGFKRYLSKDKVMPDKLCRFVNAPAANQ